MFHRNRANLDNEYSIAAANPYLPKDQFVVYIMGQANYDLLSSMGFNCKMVTQENFKWPTDEIKKKATDMGHTWINKLYLLHHAMNDYDEIVYLDWDTQPVKGIPSDFWEKMAEKREIQAVLKQYKNGDYAWWRPGKWQKRIVCSGGFIYCRDKKAFSTMLSFHGNKDFGAYWLDESYIAYYTDGLMGGWKSIDNIPIYESLFEPYCAMDKANLLCKNKNQDDIIFKHPYTMAVTTA